MRISRDFAIFWASQALSVAGDSFTLVAIPLLVLHTTGSVAQMGMLTAAMGAASVLTGIFAGTIADKFNRRVILITADVVRALLYGLIPLVWLFSPQVWLLYVVMPLGGAALMLFQVTYVTVVPQLVEPDRITEANGRLHATYAAMSIAGPLLAGIVSGLFGPSTAIAIDAASFGLSALGLSLIRLRANASSARTPGSFLVGARFLWRHPVLRTLTILLSLHIFLTYGLTDIFIYHLKHVLGQSDAVVGYVLGAGAVATIAGSLAVARLRKVWGFGISWIFSYALCGLAISAAAFALNVPVMGLLVAMFTFGVSIAGICSMSLRQEVTPSHLLGRVTSAFWTIHFAWGPLGAVLFTAAVPRYGTTVVFLGIGLASLAIAVGSAFTPLRTARPELLPASA